MINTLQQLVPNRSLNRGEALAIAEHQAHKLRQLLNIDQAAIATEQLERIPGIHIETVPGLHVSGATRHIENIWIIIANRDEATVRQRFTIAHEIKHILDDQAATHLRDTATPNSSPSWLTERICDYFAACLLVPKLWLKRAWTTGTQDITDLARHFDVSRDVIRIRLEQTGLADRAQRCRGYHPAVVPLPARQAV